MQQLRQLYIWKINYWTFKKSELEINTDNINDFLIISKYLHAKILLKIYFPRQYEQFLICTYCPYLSLILVGSILLKKEQATIHCTKQSCDDVLTALDGKDPIKPQCVSSFHCDFCLPNIALVFDI